MQIPKPRLQRFWWQETFWGPAHIFSFSCSFCDQLHAHRWLPVPIPLWFSAWWLSSVTEACCMHPKCQGVDVSKSSLQPTSNTSWWMTTTPFLSVGGRMTKCVSQKSLGFPWDWFRLSTVISLSLTYLLLAFPSFPVSFLQIPPVRYWDDLSNKLLAPKSLSKVLLSVDPKGADSERRRGAGWSAFLPSRIVKHSGMWTPSQPLFHKYLPVCRSEWNSSVTSRFFSWVETKRFSKFSS